MSNVEASHPDPDIASYLAAAPPDARLARRADGAGEPGAATVRGIGISEFGGALREMRVPLRPVGPTDVEIRLVGAGVGPWDSEERAGKVPVPLPRLLGWFGSGVVVAVGDEVDPARDVAVGDAVVAYQPFGGFYAERVVVPAALVTRAPRNVPLADAGSMLIGACTALQAVDRVGQAQPGQRVLITAAAGVTGAYAVELAKHRGAVVIGTGSADSAAYLRDELGVDVVVDYHAPDALDQVHRAAPGGVDVFVDGVGPENFTRYATLVRPGGRAVGLHRPHPDAPPGVHNALLLSWEHPDTFAEAVRLVEAGVFTVRVAHRIALADAQRALDHVGRRRGRGATLLLV